MTRLTHDELVQAAVRWLKRHGYSTIITQKSIVNDEQPDAIGFKADGFSMLIECKTTRNDFNRDRQKTWRKHPALGMGLERYYLAPEGVLHVKDMPERWGLITLHRGKLLKQAHPLAFVERNTKAELVHILAALRRAEGKVRPMRKPGNGPTNKPRVGQLAAEHAAELDKLGKKLMDDMSEAVNEANASAFDGEQELRRQAGGAPPKCEDCNDTGAERNPRAGQPREYTYIPCQKNCPAGLKFAEERAFDQVKR